MNILNGLNEVNCRIPHKELVAAILESALAAADPVEAVRRNLSVHDNYLVAGGEEYPITNNTRLVTVALGKAAPAMLRGAGEVLGKQLKSGVCVTKHVNPAEWSMEGITVIKGDHPMPGEGSLLAGRAIQAALTGLDGDDIVLVLLSGGGSALATLPVEGVSLEEMRQMTGVLLRAGVTITELNSVRKHLDRIKGGGLLRMAAPAQVVALVLSDVVGNPLDVIASGPAYPDDSTYADALQIVRNAEKFGDIPESIINHLQLGVSGSIPESVKPGDSIVATARNFIIGSNNESCRAAVVRAQALGFNAELVTDRLIGEARDAGGYLAGIARVSDRPTPWMLVFGGETTVTVTGNGIGGRNQEVALGAVRGMQSLRARFLITLATDGEDGPTDAAGAIVDGTTFECAVSAGLDPEKYLKENDANNFFKKIGDLLVIGPTGTNVNDINFLFGFDQ